MPPADNTEPIVIMVMLYPRVTIIDPKQATPIQRAIVYFLPKLSAK